MGGPIIFREFDRASLDAQYNNRKRFPRYIEHFTKWQAWSAETRDKLTCRLDLSYGPAATERLDIFPAASPNAPLWVFIHGGYWQSLDKADFSYVAEGMVAHGVSVAVINYALAPDHGMDEIVRQNRAALAWLYQHAAAYGADPNRITACGHSAGGHLVMMLLATDWPAFGAGLPTDLVKAGSTISGLYEMEPIRLCYLNDVLGMDAAVTARNTPVAQNYPVAAPILIVLGDDESEEYHRQTRVMDEFWRGLGYPAEVYVPKDLDHFSIVDSLIQPDTELVSKHIALIPH